MLWLMILRNPTLSIVLDIVFIVLTFLFLGMWAYNYARLKPWMSIIKFKRMAVVVGRDRMARLYPMRTKDGIHYYVEGLDNPDVLISPETMYHVRNVPSPLYLSVIYLPSGIAQDVEKMAAITKLSEEGVTLKDCLIVKKDEEGNVVDVKIINKKVDIDKPVVIRVQDIINWFNKDYNPKYIREYKASAAAGSIDILGGITKTIMKWNMYLMIALFIGIIVLGFILRL